MRCTRPLHATIYADSTLENHAADTPILAVLTRQAGGAWRIKALQNVTLANPGTSEPVLRDLS